MISLSRRLLIAMFGAAATGSTFSLPALADDGIGTTVKVSGSGLLVRGGAENPLSEGAALNEGDNVQTGADALAELLLNTETRINMGPDSEITIEKFLADMGGTITVGGAMVFDRPEDMPPVDLTFKTEFGEIGVRGTRFFFGPSKGKMSVFVQRGKVTVSNAGVTRELAGGDGVDMEAGAPPSEVAKWKEPRIVAAFGLVGLTP